MPFFDLNQDEQIDFAEGFKVQFLHTRHMTLAYWTIDAGAVLPPHKHPHEQVTNIIEGQFELTIDKSSKTMKAGMGAIIPSNTVHFGKALTTCIVIDVFYPIREEYRKELKSIEGL